MTATHQIIITAAAATAIMVAAQSGLYTSAISYSAITCAADSLTASPTDSAVVSNLDLASELYRKIKFAQTESEPDAAYYNLVFGM